MKYEMSPLIIVTAKCVIITSYIRINSFFVDLQK